MDSVLEKQFAENYFKKDVRDRIAAELSSAKNRVDFFTKIAHTSEELLEPAKIFIKKDTPIDRSVLKRYFSAEACYVMFYGSDYDGFYMRFDEAMEMFWSNGMPFIMISETCEYAYIETEYDFSNHKAFLLEKSRT